ncbi:unnamed protein product [Alopecurus aequalis]
MDAQSPFSPLRIVIVPWLGFGHLLPCLELAERLAERGHHVTYVSTPRNLARLPPLRPATTPGVNLVAVPLPRVDGLPDGAESTNDVPGDDRELHWKAFDGLAAPFAEFLAAACANKATRPHWIIADSFHHWAAASALEQQVPCAMLLPSAAMLVSLFKPSAAPVPRHEQETASAITNPGASGMSIFQRFTLTIERCTVGAIRSCVEWEPEMFPIAVAIFGKPLMPLGLLPPSPVGGRRAAGSEEHTTVRWLDAQPSKSVVYVALGSEVPLSVEQVHELALGLELAETRFLWVLRKPSGVTVLDDDDDGSDMLPPGFQKRMHALALVTTGWVPQMSILAHASVGGFLTHCGRGSLVEGLLFGCPLVLLPIFGDQGPNARQMELNKVGLQVAREEKDGSFDRHGIASAVQAVLVDGEARRGFVVGAAKMNEVVADNELHDRYIDEFIRQLRSYAAGSGATAAPDSS